MLNDSQADCDGRVSSRTTPSTVGKGALRVWPRIFGNSFVRFTNVGCGIADIEIPCTREFNSDFSRLTT